MRSSLKNMRVRTPQLEHEINRTPEVGFETAVRNGCVRYLEHGVPNPLVRWHWHEEYELHLIVASRGKAFVGDYIGDFEPGHLVLTGPGVPHNWITSDVPKGGIPVRDVVLQFPDAPLRSAAALIPELTDALPLLARARYGIEFFGLGERALIRHQKIKNSRGLVRFATFVEWLSELAEWPDYRYLSTMQLASPEDAATQARIQSIVGYIKANHFQQISMADVCQREGMTESSFSRYFHRSTGNTFTAYVNGVRIAQACQLLIDTDRYIANICYDVGFNNIANFNRRFLESKGMTPKEFRRQSEARFGTGKPSLLE